MVKLGYFFDQIPLIKKLYLKFFQMLINVGNFIHKISQNHFHHLILL